MFKHFIVALVLAGVVPLVGTRRLKYYLLACGVFSIPFSYDATLFALSTEKFQGWVSGIIIRLSDVFFVLIPLFCRKEAPFGHERPSPFWMDRSSVIFLAMVFASMLFPSDRKTALVAGFELALIVSLYYWVTTRYFNWKDDGEYILKCLAVAVVFQSCLAVWQACFQNGFDFFRTGSAGFLTLQDDYVRTQGTVPQPNGFASYLCLTLLPLLAGRLLSKSDRKGILTWSLVLGVVALITTLSRGGWLGLSVGALYIAWRRLGFRRALRTGLLWGMVLTMVILALPQVRERLTGDDGGSAQDRWYLAQIALGMIADNPAIGVGINNYRIAMWKYVPKDYEWDLVYRVHTLPLLIFAEMGVVGLLAFLYLFWRGISLSLGLPPGTRSSSGLILAGVAAACLAVLVHGFFDIVWAAPPVTAQFFFILGLGALVRQQIDTNLEGVTLSGHEVMDESQELSLTPGS